MTELEPAFGDTSALVPLCVQQKGSSAVEQLFDEYSIIVWWAAPVEIWSALAKLLRMGLLSPAEYQQAQKQIEVLRQSWREIQPHDSVRSLAGSLPKAP